jgi:hypothetical protein
MSEFSLFYSTVTVVFIARKTLNSGHTCTIILEKLSCIWMGGWAHLFSTFWPKITIVLYAKYASSTKFRSTPVGPDKSEISPFERYFSKTLPKIHLNKL